MVSFCGGGYSIRYVRGYIHSVPEAYRDIIRERLNRWFSIPIQHRTNILANVKTFAFHRQVGGNAARGKGLALLKRNEPSRKAI